MTDKDTSAEIAGIVAEAAGLPLLDAAYAVWRRRHRLDSLEGRPDPERVAAFRVMSPPEQAASLRHYRDTAQDGPTFMQRRRLLQQIARRPTAPQKHKFVTTLPRLSLIA